MVIFSYYSLSPTVYVKLLDPVRAQIGGFLHSVTFAEQMFSTYFYPLVVIFVNFIVIPSLIEICVSFEDHVRKSAVVGSSMRRIFIFMLLNTLLIPITATGSLDEFYEQAKIQGIEHIPSMLSNNMMAQQNFFITLIIQLTFITNGLSLIDAPHQIYKWISRKIYNRNNSHLLFVPPFEDDYEFDYGYNYSYCLVIFLNCLLFSNIVPIIPIFGVLYFYIKYLCDKYNLVFTYYQSNFDSGGEVRQGVNNIQVFNLILYLLVIESFFSIKFSG